MHVGIELAPSPATATPLAVQACAKAAEAVGYRSVWIVLRPLVPVAGPIALLGGAAASSSRLGLGISIDPGRSSTLPGLDGLPAARLSVGLPADAAVVGRLERGWRPPWRLLLGAARSGIEAGELDAAARSADGWHAVGVPVGDLAAAIGEVRDCAARYGRDPAGFGVVVRADVAVTPAPLGADRRSYHGSLRQVAGDLLATRDAGADELVLALAGAGCLDEVLATYADLVEVLEPDPTAPPHPESPQTGERSLQ